MVHIAALLKKKSLCKLNSNYFHINASFVYFQNSIIILKIALLINALICIWKEGGFNVIFVLF